MRVGSFPLYMRVFFVRDKSRGKIIDNDNQYSFEPTLDYNFTTSDLRNPSTGK